MILLKWMCALSILVTSIAMADDAGGKTFYRMDISGTNLAEINQIKNCIDYIVCEYANVPEFSQKGKRAKMAIEIALTPDEAEQVASRCVLPYSQQFQIRTNPSLPATRVADALWNESPVYLEQMDLKSTKQSLEQIYELSLAGKSMQAIELTKDLLRLNFEDYSLGPQPGDVERDKAITNHVEKTVLIGKGVLTGDECGLALGMRHEAEHIYQAKRAYACLAKGMNTSLNDRLYRERSAYFNDMLNLPRYCSQGVEIEQNLRLQYVFSHYPAPRR